MANATHIPIVAVFTVSGNQEAFLEQALEAAGQTFQQGTPVQKSTTGGTSGFFIASTPSNGTTQVIIAGITYLPGQNFAANGGNAPPAQFGSYGFPGGAGALNNVINQPAAVSIYHGAPFQVGSITGAQANYDTIFELQVDASSGTTFNATTALIGSTIALAIDANGFWYADLAHVNSASYADAIVQSLNPLDFVPGSLTTQQNFGRIRVRINPTVFQL